MEQSGTVRPVTLWIVLLGCKKGPRHSPISAIHKVAIWPAAEQTVVWRAFQLPAPFRAYGDFRNCTRQNHGTVGNREASGFVNSTVYVQELTWVIAMKISSKTIIKRITLQLYWGVFNNWTSLIKNMDKREQWMIDLVFHCRQLVDCTTIVWLASLCQLNNFFSIRGRQSMNIWYLCSIRFKQRVNISSNLLLWTVIGLYNYCLTYLTLPI